MIWSCSPPVSSRGGSRASARARCPTSWNASDVAVRASGPLVGTPMRSAMRSRSRVAAERDARQREHLVRRVPALQHALGERLDERGRLAGARGAEHGGGFAVGQGEDGELRVVEGEVGPVADRLSAGPETSDRHA